MRILVVGNNYLIKKKFTSWDQSVGRISLGENSGKGHCIPYKLSMYSLDCSLASSRAYYIVFWFQTDPARYNLFITDLCGMYCMVHIILAWWRKND